MENVEEGWMMGFDVRGVVCLVGDLLISLEMEMF